jgi:hypothetical protein
MKHYWDDFTEFDKYLQVMTIFPVKEESGILLHFLKDRIVSFTCNTVII